MSLSDSLTARSGQLHEEAYGIQLTRLGEWDESPARPAATAGGF